MDAIRYCKAGKVFKENEVALKLEKYYIYYIYYIYDSTGNRR